MKYSPSSLNIKKILCYISFGIVLCIFVVQFYGNAKISMKIYHNFNGRDAEEKRIMIWGFVHDYARQVKQYVKGYYTARLETSVDISCDPGMSMHRSLAYFLYPIDFRMYQGDKPDIIVYFEKKDAMSTVPDGYYPHLVFNERNLIAVADK